VTVAWSSIVLSAAWLGFTYAGYPLIVWLLARLAPRSVRSGDAFPPISVIIAVHNGERDLARKLDATLDLAYPGDVEVIVASDGSSDGTDAIAESKAERGVRLVRNEPRAGKEAAQAAAIAQAVGEILVFTDLAAELEPEALRNIVRPFADATVGAVSSNDVVDSEGGEGRYVRFEMALRELESRATSIVGLSGSFFAVRRALCTPWPADLASDFRIALEAASRGFRAVSEPTARAHFRAAEQPAAEWARKVRTVRRGIAVLSAYRSLLNPRYGRIALSLWGHKVARFTSPFALVLLLVASAIAASETGLAAALLGGQIAFYGLGLAALLAPSVIRWGFARIAGYFLLVNASIAVGWVYHLTGRRAVLWKPTQR
jgi:cellulose synthase/poly-beta-1,6-N-acetylglucosamine synthase-like glycosyltransferase